MFTRLEILLGTPEDATHLCLTCFFHHNKNAHIYYCRFERYYAMVVCRSHDTAGSLVHGVFISKPIGNSDPLAKSRPTGKIQTHWLGHKVVHNVTRNIQKLKSCSHQYFIYIHIFNKTMA